MTTLAAPTLGTPAASDDLLRIEGLVVRRTADHVPLVDAVDLGVRRGEVMGVVGESGSGKTLTALAVLGLLPEGTVRSSGRIVLDGVDLHALDERGLSDLRGSVVAYIPQEPMSALDPAFRVGSQIAEVYRRHRGGSRRAAKQAAELMLATVGLPDPRQRMDDYPHQMSGGMRQRVLIAMAMICEPALLIADEPTTALDVTVQAQILDLLLGLSNERNLSVVFVTHDLDVVSSVCDRVAVMYAGHVVETNCVEELFADPCHPYTRALLASATSIQPEPGGRSEQPPLVQGSVPAPGSWPAPCRFEDRCQYAADVCRHGTDIPLDHVGDDAAVRCVRHGDLAGQT